ncbi:hypothetical protein VT06_04955 [Arsukibacterium sp. MJ3]|uniref:DUF5992 family protein n=1 Tax=Arsukibacterium sp. MJ3 TaxID=1632859 RepID=UPI0006270123|nr:DUF5992 family protein [Arsukibacterium sp. MJ3]KKO49556.1 hypothetical protein VT06_04955 [Arsukibacterium sp. MJ3]
MMKICLMALILFYVAFGMFASAGELTRGATVLEVANHATGNGKNFAIKVEGGTGPCVGWIYFLEKKGLQLISFKGLKNDKKYFSCHGIVVCGWRAG